MGDLWSEATNWAETGWDAWDDPFGDIEANFDQFKTGFTNPISTTVQQIFTTNASSNAQQASDEDQASGGSSVTTWLVLAIVAGIVILLVLGKLEAL